jgi:putative ABC transport system substrate-binding protein
MAAVSDAVRSNFVNSLARPGGNITGLTTIAPELAGKRLELLKETIPKLSRVAFLAHGEGSGYELFVKEAQQASANFRIQIYPVIVKRAEELVGAFGEMRKHEVSALVVQPFFIGGLGHGRRIADLAVANGFPSVSDLSQFADAGGLMSYGPDLVAQTCQAATYVEKILKGANPGDLPVEQPTKFEMVINLKTAKQLGITIPQKVLARADRVIR